MSARRWIVLAAGGSAALLAGAFLFQALGYAPCKMCLWQRWPHAVAVVIGALVLLSLRPALALLGALAALSTAGIGLYHTGVERGYWPGPSSCSGGGAADLGALSGADLLSTALPEDIVLCDEVVWSFFGLSMASWNALISLGLVLIWLKVFSVQRQQA